ncbi:MAG: hypothetical protein RSD57_12385 [Comamonas sp.]
MTTLYDKYDQTEPPITERLNLPVAPETRAITLLAHLWRKYDAAGISMGRSHEAVVLEAVLSLLGEPDPTDMDRLNEDSGVLISDTRSYLSACRAVQLGLIYRPLTAIDAALSATTPPVAKEG